ncbi:MAG: adenylate kinase [Oscillospiraceae bacterium]
MDHLKMGLIRSKNISLTPLDDEKLMPYLCGIVKEMMKTAVENQQNLIIEGGYIPFNWAEDFGAEYLKNIDYYCLVMIPEYIKKHFIEILEYANIIEKRKNNLEYSVEQLIAENDYNLAMCQKFGNKFILIEDNYRILI